jgi:hypothetical protein
MDEQNGIWYLDRPHFAIGRPDQWGEKGYLLHEQTVYFYEVDRKDQCYETRLPMTIDAFLAHTEEYRIPVPNDFLEALRLESLLEISE